MDIFGKKKLQSEVKFSKNAATQGDMIIARKNADIRELQRKVEDLESEVEKLKHLLDKADETILAQAAELKKKAPIRKTVLKVKPTELESLKKTVKELKKNDLDKKVKKEVKKSTVKKTTTKKTSTKTTKKKETK